MESVGDHLRLVKYLVEKFQVPDGCEKDDLFQVGCIGLYKAIKSFDENKGYKFSTYASVCINNEIRLLLREMKKINGFNKGVKVVHLEQKIIQDENLVLADVLKNDDDVEKSVELNLIIEKYKFEKDWQILMENVSGYTQVEIGKKIGTNKYNVAKKIFSLRNKMRKNEKLYSSC